MRMPGRGSGLILAGVIVAAIAGHDPAPGVALPDPPADLLSRAGRRPPRSARAPRRRPSGSSPAASSSATTSATSTTGRPSSPTGEVNAWLADDLVTTSPTRSPPRSTSPGSPSSPTAITLAFQLDRGPIRSVDLGGRPGPGPRGQRPGPDPGEDPRRGRPDLRRPDHRPDSDSGPRARPRRPMDQGDTTSPSPTDPLPARPGKSSDIVLERLSIRQGQIRLSGRSDRLQGTFDAPTLPTRSVLQLNFPKRNRQSRAAGQPDLAKLDEADELTSPDLQPTSSAPQIHDPALAPVPAPDRASPARDLPFIIQIDSPMRRECPRRQVQAGDDRGIDGPRPQGRPVLDQEIPVDAVPGVFQDGEPANPLPHHPPDLDPGYDAPAGSSHPSGVDAMPGSPTLDQFGCLLGLAVGDALGAPFEGLPDGYIDGLVRAGVVLDDLRPTLRYTDDTQMMISPWPIGARSTPEPCSHVRRQLDSHRGSDPPPRLDPDQPALHLFPGGSLGRSGHGGSRLLFRDLDRVARPGRDRWRPSSWPASPWRLAPDRSAVRAQCGPRPSTKRPTPSVRRPIEALSDLRRQRPITDQVIRRSTDTDTLAAIRLPRGPRSGRSRLGVAALEDSPRGEPTS